MHPIVNTFIQRLNAQMGELILDNVNVEHLARGCNAGLAALTKLTNKQRLIVEPIAKAVNDDDEGLKAMECLWAIFTDAFRKDVVKGFKKGELYSPDDLMVGELFVRGHYLMAVGSIESDEQLWELFLQRNVELESFAEFTAHNFINAVDVFAAIESVGKVLVSGQEAETVRVAFRDVSKILRKSGEEDVQQH